MTIRRASVKTPTDPERWRLWDIFILMVWLISTVAFAHQIYLVLRHLVGM